MASAPALPPVTLPGRVALLFGGVSPEHEVSISSASQATGALAELLARGAAMHIETVYLNKDGQWIWRANGGKPLTLEQILEAPRWDCQPDEHDVDVLSFAEGLGRLTEQDIEACLLMLHGTNCEDGRLQGALDLSGIAYTGSGSMASALCMNKPRTQAVLNAARLPIAKSIALREDQPTDPAHIIEAIGLPLVVKPAESGSSVGMSIVREAEQLPAALELGFQIDVELIIEQFVAGREFTAGVLERPVDEDKTEAIALPIVEIIPPAGDFFTYEAKYHDPQTRELVPAPIPEAISARMRELALRTHMACGCRGYSRVDMLCDVAAGAEPVILEINTLPGMTARSLLPQAAAAVGIDYPNLLALMLATARYA